MYIRKKTLDMNYLQLKCNRKPLNTNLRLSQSGLYNNAIITVEKTETNSSLQKNLKQPTQYVNNIFGQ